MIQTRLIFRCEGMRWQVRPILVAEVLESGEVGSLQGDFERHTDFCPGFERMSRFFHMPAHLRHEMPPLLGGGFEPNDARLDNAEILNTYYQALSALFSGTAGLFLLLAFALNGLAIIVLPS